MFCEVELRCDPDFSVAKLYHYPNRSFFSSGAKSRPESATRKFASVQKTERRQNFADAPENAWARIHLAHASPPYQPGMPHILS